MRKTTAINPKKLERKWYFIDASDMILGRIASKAAKILTGKHKAIYSTNVNVGDKVVVTNADKVRITGNKMTDKVYYSYSGFPGGLKGISFKDLQKKDSTQTLRNAVKGMLPKNKLRDVRMADLYIYKDSEHPHKAHEAKAKK